MREGNWVTHVLRYAIPRFVPVMPLQNNWPARIPCQKLLNDG